MEQDDRFEEAYTYSAQEGGLHNMCDVLDRLEEKKESEVNERVATDMLKKNYPISAIKDISRLSEDKILKIAKKLNVAVF